MQLIAPLPYREAVAKLGEKSIIGSKLNSEGWARVPVGLRDRAFFSATIESTRFLQRARDFVGDYLEGARGADGALKAGSRAQFVKELSEFAISQGLGPVDPADAGGLQDIRSQTRLSLIVDTQVQQAHDYGYWKQGQDPDVLDAFPAQRFIREAEVITPRIIHQENEGVVRLKSDLEFWTAMNSPAIGGFGVPWGPWGFNSGMGVEDVDREEAERLGLIERGAAVRPVEKEFNEQLQASTRGLAPELLDQLRQAFGDQVEIEGDSIRWAAGRPDRSSAVVPPRPVVVPPAPEVPETLEDVLAEAGIQEGQAPSADQLVRLRELLREEKPVDQAQVLTSVIGADAAGPLSVAALRQEVQELLNFLPPAVVKDLPRIRLSLKDAGGALGYYGGEGRVVLDYRYFQAHPEDLRRVVFHELMHWYHIEGRPEFKKAIADHYDARTKGEKLRPMEGYGGEGKKDKWYDEYAGKVYRSRSDGYAGLEVPTKYFETLARDTTEQTKLWQDPAFRETMMVVLKGVF